MVAENKFSIMNQSTRNFIGVILVIIGLGFLFEQMGLARGLGYSFSWLISTFWPLILIYLGVQMLRQGKSTAGYGF